MGVRFFGYVWRWGAPPEVNQSKWSGERVHIARQEIYITSLAIEDTGLDIMLRPQAYALTSGSYLGWERVRGDVPHKVAQVWW
jgi:hypothetical protein